MEHYKPPNGFAAGCEAWLCLAVFGAFFLGAMPLVRALPLPNELGPSPDQGHSPSHQ